MKSLVIATFVVATATHAVAQTHPDVQINLGLYSVKPNGGEDFEGMSSSTGAVVIGRTSTYTFSLGAGCDAWALSANTGLRDKAEQAWKIETTAISVAGDAVTFRLTTAKSARPVAPPYGLIFLTPESVELTLRPGQSWPIAVVPLPKSAKTVHGEPCWHSAVIRASVNGYPSADSDHRLVSTDLWLVEHLANGSEAPRSQPVTIRAVPNQPERFFFDSIADGADTLDFYGDVRARIEPGGVRVDLETRARRKDAPRGFMAPHAVVESEILVAPGETVDINLATLGDIVGPFASRRFSIRVRARQAR